MIFRKKKPAPFSEGAIKDRPWLCWLLVCLCRQRERQAWLVHIHKTHLSNMDEEAGPVPGLPDWSYEFHGAGLLLAGPNNELIDFDFHDQDGATIDPWFFTRRVRALRAPELPEKELRRWCYNEDVMMRGLDELEALGFIEKNNDQHVFRLKKSYNDNYEAVAEADYDNEGTGDYTESYRAWIKARMRDRKNAGKLFVNLDSAFPADEISRIASDLLKGPIDHTTGKVLEAVAALDADLTDLAKDALGRLEPEEHHPYICWAVCKYLLRRKKEREECLGTIEAFANVLVVKGYNGNPFQDELAILMIEFAPERALPLIRLALRSTVPAVVENISALLAVVDAPWCQKELASALPGKSDSKRGTVSRFLSAALMASDNELAKQRGVKSDPGIPAREPDAVGYTYDEVLANSIGSEFSYAMEKARHTAASLAPQLMTIKSE